MCSFNHVLKNLMYHISGCQTLTIKQKHQVATKVIFVMKIQNK